MKPQYTFLVLVLLLSGQFLVTASEEQGQSDLPSAAEALSRADTLYWLARSMNNDPTIHQRSLAVFEQALAAAIEESDQRLRVAAQAGIDRGHERVDAASESFRGLFPLAWFLRAERIVYERIDEADERAALNAWAPFTDWVQRPEFQVLPFIVRVRNDLPAGVVRFAEMLEATGDATGRLISVPDATVRQLLGPQGVPGAIGTPPQPKDLALVGHRVLVLDAVLSDVIANQDPVYRVTMSAWLVDTHSGATTTIGITDGLSIDVRGRYSAGFWLMSASVLLLALFTLVLPIGRSRPVSFAVAGGCAIVGLLVVHLGLPVLDVLLPGMEEMSLSPSGSIRMDVLLWPLSTGLIFGLLIGPGSLVVSALAQTRLAPAVADQLRCERMGPAVAIGLGMGTMADVLILDPAGWQTTLAWFASLVGLSLAMIPALTNLRDDAKADHPRHYISLVCGPLMVTVGWVCLLAGAPLTAVLVASCGAAATALLGWPSSQLQLGQRDGAQTLVAASVPSGTVTHPGYIIHSGLDPQALARDLAQHQGVGLVVSLVGERGAGKTRNAEEILLRRRALSASGAAVRPVIIGRYDPSQPQSDGERAVAYGGLIALLRDLLPVEELLRNQERRIKIEQGAGKAGQALLERVPGVGLLLGSEAAETDGTMTKDRLHRDIAVMLQRLLTQKDVVLFIDDWQWLDIDSRAALQDLPNRLPRSARGLSIIIARHPIAGSADPEDLHQILPGVGCEDRGWAVVERRVGALDAAAITDLVQACGLVRPDAQQVEWLSGVGQTAGDCVSVLAAFAAQGLLHEQAGLPALPAAAELNHLNERIPNDLVDRQASRLKVLDREDMVLLELAAQCGRRFTGTQLAAGQGIMDSRLLLLDRLRSIEDEFGFVEDIEDEDVFRFESETIRQALLKQGAKRTTEIGAPAIRDRELVREFHYRVANWIAANPESGFPPEVLFNHCQKAGLKVQHIARKAVVAAAEHAASLGIWPRVSEWLDRLQGYASPVDAAQRDRESLLRARALRAAGGQDRREQAREVFLALRHSSHVDAAHALLDAGEVWMEERDFAEIARFNAFISEELDQRPDDRRVGLVWQFYKAITDQRLAGFADMEARTTAVSELDRLVGDCEQYAADGDRIMGQLLGRIRQEQAVNFSRIVTARKEADRHAEVDGLFEQVITIKTRFGDRHGLAYAYGSRAAFHEEIGDLGQARQWLERDLELVQEMGIRGDEATLHNRLAGLIWAQAAATEDAIRKRDLQQAAWDGATRSLTLNLELARELDATYAALNVIRFAPLFDAGEYAALIAQSIAQVDWWLDDRGIPRLDLDRFAAAFASEQYSITVGPLAPVLEEVRACIAKAQRLQVRPS